MLKTLNETIVQCVNYGEDGEGDNCGDKEPRQSRMFLLLYWGKGLTTKMILPFLLFVALMIDPSSFMEKHPVLTLGGSSVNTAFIKFHKILHIWVEQLSQKRFPGPLN